MADIFKITKAKITQTFARTGGKASGGKMTRLRCGGLSNAENTLFSSKEEWSISIGTSVGIIPTLFYVKPKKQGKNNQNSVKIRELNLSQPPHPNLCKNFDKSQSLFKIIEHYCPKWTSTKNPSERKSIAQEILTDFLMLEDKYSKRGLLVLLQPDSKFQLQTLTVNNHITSSVLIESAINHLGHLSIFENVTDFLNKWESYQNNVKVEKDIEQKRDDLERIGFECYFKDEGVDSPASKLTIIKDNSKIEFNIDIELKHEAKSFFRKKEASNIKKYPRLPILIIANKDSSDEPLHQQLLHPTISLTKLLQTLSAKKISALPILRALDEEIERLNRIVDQESNDLELIKTKRATKKKSA